jgi:xanthine dehydrogenase iron-sulfur cluster and FAD-binding subunit A
VEDFVTGYRANARRPDELIESLWLPRRPAGERRAFRKVGTRRAQSIAKLSLALAVTMQDGRIAALRGAAGSVAERTVPLAELERTLVGRAPDPALVRLAAGRSVRADTRARSDVRSTAEYRAAVLERLIVRLLVHLTGERAGRPARP